MSRVFVFTVGLALMTSAAAGQPLSQQKPQQGLSAMRYASVLLVEIEEVRTSPWEKSDGGMQIRTLTVRARVPRVLRDEMKQSLVPDTFTSTVTQGRWPRGFTGDNPYLWSDRDLEAGQQYLVFSNARGAAAAIFASPETVEPVTGDVDAASDVELIQELANTSLQQQSQAVATALRTAVKPRSRFLAEYAARLLASGSDVETGELTRALHDTTTVKLSEDAKRTLLWEFFQQARTRNHVSDGLVRTFVTMTGGRKRTGTIPR